jgi:adenine-specific DNA-methyltransferase
MSATYSQWDAASPLAWARALGLVHVPLFGPEARQQTRWGDCAVLLDGPKSSLAVCSVGQAGGAERGDFLGDENPMLWSWSSQLRHVLILNPSLEDMYLRRWDAPEEFRRFKMPGNPRAAAKLLPKLTEDPQLTAVTAVLHALRGFRQVRQSLPSRDAFDAIRVFNAFLLGVEAAQLEQVDRRRWAASTRVEEALEELRKAGIDVNEALGQAGLRQDTRSAGIDGVLEWFVSPEPTTGWILDSGLLIRHAAGQLYQEAHVLIERDDQLSLFPAMATTRRRGPARSDVHFTPVALARFLVQEALTEHGTATSDLTILDPACGSGIFLLEALRELQSIGWKGTVKLRGFDISAVSCAMANFCLARAKREAAQDGICADVHVGQADALQRDWEHPDIVLMNPPFVSWESMDHQERDTVVQVLGAVAKKRMDKAMAFLWRAVQCLDQGGVLASLLPAPLFETQAGVEWREAIASQGDLRLLGRLRGYKHFQDSLVEPGMLVFSRPGEPTRTTRTPTRLLVADEGREDEAVRGARRFRLGDGPPQGEGWEVVQAPGPLPPENWMPRARKQLELIDALRRAGVATAGELFIVHLGIRTGLKSAFVLAENEVRDLPKRERRFFRPIASTSTIREGTIRRGEFVFYPYGETGLLLPTEDSVKKEVPTYYSGWLQPRQDELTGRSRARAHEWWALARERPWQHAKQPKLVSKAFGGPGGFAYDTSGDFVVLQGYGWLWKGARRERSQADFHSSPLPFAYLALLNSSVFDLLLGLFCPRVQGGQYDLSTRFVANVFLPDLTDVERMTSDTVIELAELGRRIHEGAMPSPGVLAQASAGAYGIAGAEIADLLPPVRQGI